MAKDSTEFGFKIPLYVKAIGIVLFVIAAGLTLEYERRRNVSDIENFYKTDVKGIVKKIEKGSGGFCTIYTTDGQLFRFCGSGSFIVENVVNGDSITKPPYSNTLRVYAKNKDLKLTFLKPD